MGTRGPDRERARAALDALARAACGACGRRIEPLAPGPGVYLPGRRCCAQHCPYCFLPVEPVSTPPGGSLRPCEHLVVRYARVWVRSRHLWTRAELPRFSWTAGTPALLASALHLRSFAAPNGMAEWHYAFAPDRTAVLTVIAGV